MKNYILITILLNTLLFGGKCADEFSPDKFIESSPFLEDLIETNFQETALFASAKEYEKLKFKKVKNHFYKNNSFTPYRDYKYPKQDGFWSYKIDANEKVDEVNIAQLESTREDPLTIADMITSDFEGDWYKWDGDAYEHYLVPEYSRIKYKNYYLSLKVIFWGSGDDSAKLQRSTINYRLIDFTDEVNHYKECINLP